MKRFFLALGLATLLAPLPGSAQYPPGTPEDGPNQMVQEWYNRFLGRAPDQYASTWVSALRSGQAPEAVLSQILGSDEYYMRAGNTPQGFVSRLHQDLTGRAPGPEEAQSWINRLYQSSRQDVAYQMLMRYPQNWGAAPTTSFGDDWDRDHNRRWRDEHEFRRPYWRYPIRR